MNGNNADPINIIYNQQLLSHVYQRHSQKMPEKPTKPNSSISQNVLLIKQKRKIKITFVKVTNLIAKTALNRIHKESMEKINKELLECNPNKQTKNQSLHYSFSQKRTLKKEMGYLNKGSIQLDLKWVNIPAKTTHDKLK